MKKETSSMKRNRFIANTAVHIILTIMAIVWLFPVVWLLLESFNSDPDSGATSFLPKGFSLNSYIKLFTDTTQIFFVKWFFNTLFVAIGTCLLSTFYVLCVSYSLSRLRFKARKTLMNVGLILNMFPGFMSMIAVYYILKGLGFLETGILKQAKDYVDTEVKELADGQVATNTAAITALQTTHAEDKATLQAGIDTNASAIAAFTAVTTDEVKALFA